MNKEVLSHHDAQSHVGIQTLIIMSAGGKGRRGEDGNPCCLYKPDSGESTFSNQHSLRKKQTSLRCGMPASINLLPTKTVFSEGNVCCNQNIFLAVLNLQKIIWWLINFLRVCWRPSLESMLPARPGVVVTTATTFARRPTASLHAAGLTGTPSHAHARRRKPGSNPSLRVIL